MEAAGQGEKVEEKRVGKKQTSRFHQEAGGMMVAAARRGVGLQGPGGGHRRVGNELIDGRLPLDAVDGWPDHRARLAFW